MPLLQIFIEDQRKKQSFVFQIVVGEIFLAEFITVLFEKLSSVDLIRLARSEGLYSQLNKWNNTLQIQLVLADAHLAYDIDDLLDDLATEAMRRNLNEQFSANTSKVFKFIPTCCTDFTPHTIGVAQGDKCNSCKRGQLTTKEGSLWEMEWSDVFDDSRNEIIEYEVLEGLRPYTKTSGLFPCLREISIIKFLKLAVVAIETMLSLRVLRIRGCSIAVLRNMVNVSPSVLRLTMVNIEGLTQLDGDVWNILEELNIYALESVINLNTCRESKPEACEILKSLWDLRVKFSQKLLSLVEKEATLGMSLKFIRHVDISNCLKLETYNCPNSIEKLVISSFQVVTSLTFLPLTSTFGEIRHYIIS
ncbi:hypothetical protein L6452_42639 [Arctium lappa]|uniref:Uncharacterized protein n=1 Tax=Arctium lappa TaxID=4217 RepID=A0ACB8XI72_ARCLA|nr:hypothetical protein L6452_42639 [Arctium lappa]